MTIAKSADLRTNLKKYLDMADNSESVIIPRNKKFVAIISSDDYELLEKAKKNKAYLDKLNRSMAEIESGNIVMKSIEELEAYED